MSAVNVQNATGAGTVPIAVDSISGTSYQLIKFGYGEAGSFTFVSPTHPLPITFPGTITVLATQNTNPWVVSQNDTFVVSMDDAATNSEQLQQTSRLGGVSDTMPAFDTASSAINGRLQRVCYNLTNVYNALSSVTEISTGTYTAGTTPFLLIGGYDGTHFKPISVDSTGAINIVGGGGGGGGSVTISGSLPAGSNSIGTVVLGAGAAAIGTVSLTGSLPAGTNAIGSLTAGSAVIGKVDINSALPAGSNSIGTVVLGAGVASIGSVSVSNFPSTQATSRTWTLSSGTDSVAIGTALPAGSNSIGTVVLGSGSAAIGSLTAGSAVIGKVDINSALPAGANSIGTVVLGAGSAAIGSLTAGSAVIGKVDINSALPAGSNSIGTVVLGAGSAAIGSLTAGSAVIGKVDINSALPAGSNSIGTVVLGAGAATVGNVGINSALPAGTNTIGGVVIKPTTTGGFDSSSGIYNLISAGSTNFTNIKNTGGQVYNIVATNTNASARYLKLYNKSSTPSSSDTPAITLCIPGNTSGAGINIKVEQGIAFASGIGIGLTTDSAANSTSAVAAGEIIVLLTYQ